MKNILSIKRSGTGENGVIIFFLDKCKYHRYYRSISTRLGEDGYMIMTIPYHIKGFKQKFAEELKQLKESGVTNVILMSHGRGDETIYRVHRTIDMVVDKLIITSPTRGVIHFKNTPTLVLWGDKYKPLIAHDIFNQAKNRKNYQFIGYPNVTKYLFAGVGYSRYHDRYDKRPKKTFFDVDKYFHIEEDVIEDINLFIKENRVKEKLAVFSENYLPFNSGVNILTYGLKTELEKVGKKVYPVTLKLKGVDYEAYSQDKNVIVFPSIKLPGKNAEKEALIMTFRVAHNMKYLRAYQFTYIQLQTEFTISASALLLRKIDNVPMVYTAHTMWNDMVNKRFPKVLAKIFNFGLNKFLLIPPLKFTDLMTVPTQKVKDYYIKTWGKSEPIVVIPGCVDGNNFVLQDGDEETLEKYKETYRIKDKTVIGFIGRVSKEKSIDILLDYYERFAENNDNVVLMIVGDGPHFDTLQKRIATSKFFDRIIFTGGVPNTSLKYYYRLFDVFCTASTFETQGLTYIESMWCKIPILAKYDHCLDHFLNSGVNGITFEDYDSWEEGLNKILNDEKVRQGIIDEAYKTALTYAKDVWAKKMFYLYTQAKLFNEGKIKEVNYDEFNKIGKGE